MLRASMKTLIRVSVVAALLATVGGSAGAALAGERHQRRGPGPGTLPVVLTAQLGEVALFSDAVVSGRLDPPHPGTSVTVALFLGGKAVERATVPLSADGSSYQAKLPVERWGTYHAEATWAGDSDHMGTTTKTEQREVRKPPALHQGSKGDWVTALERRLADLHYYLPNPNRSFDAATGDAVLAFHKVQGMNRIKNVTAATWKRLLAPRIPKPRSKDKKEHVEIDQSKQVLYVVRGGEIDEIIHTSTGAGSATRDGVFQVHRKIAGYSPNRLYYPSYFDGNRAVHGWPEVPNYPASHGCSRVPYWTAKHLHAIMHYGMEVRVYHS